VSNRIPPSNLTGPHPDVQLCGHIWEDVLCAIPLDGHSTLKPGKPAKFVALERCAKCSIGRLAEDSLDAEGVLRPRGTEVGPLPLPTDREEDPSTRC
jgi:hypothetical protein